MKNYLELAWPPIDFADNVSVTAYQLLVVSITNRLTINHRNLIALAIRHHECLPASGRKKHRVFAKSTTFRRRESTTNLTSASGVFNDCPR